VSCQSKLDRKPQGKPTQIYAFNNVTEIEIKNWYVEFVASMLPWNHWTTHRYLALELYTLRAEAELVDWNSPAVAVYCDAVFQRKDCSVREKAPFANGGHQHALLGRFEHEAEGLVHMCLALLKGLQHKLIYNKSSPRHQE